jgi:hypothetical protein
MSSAAVLERDVATSAALSEDQVPNMIPLLDVIRVLNEAGVSFVLVGAYGLAPWIKDPRATKDVDVVVAAKHLKKAVGALAEAFPQLEPIDIPVVVRFRDAQTEEVFINVMKPLQQPYREVFKHTKSVSLKGQTYRIPTLEMAIVMKFVSMTSPYRADDDKHQDAHDFIRMIKHNPALDKVQLAQLACLIYPDAGKAILEMVRKVQAGEKLVI